MLTKIIDDLWLDLDKIVRFSREGSEVKYTIDFKDKLVTYYAPANAGDAFIQALEKHTLGYPLDELLEDTTNNPDGDEV